MRGVDGRTRQVTSGGGDAGARAAKAELRGRLMAARAGLDPSETAEALAQAVLPLTDGVRYVASYVSVGTEPSTWALNRALDGGQLLLPVLRGDGDLDWALAAGPLVRTGRGLLEPSGPRLGLDAVAGADLVVVPALAVDRRGRRLGRGGGSYDRALRRVGAMTVALLHDGELVEDLPAEAHDVPVDAVVAAAGGLVRLS